MEIKSVYGRTIRGHMAGKRNNPRKIKDTIQIISKSLETNITMIMKGLCTSNYNDDLLSPNLENFGNKFIVNHK